MSSSSIYTSRGTPNLGIRNMTFLTKPILEIDIPGSTGPTGSFLRSYSTLDKIEGTVSISPRTDTRFNDLEITFTGIARTHVDKLSSTTAMAGRSEAIHRFLKLTQPIRNNELPQPMIFEAGRVYEFPFTFVVPPQLLPKSCSHKVAHNNVQDAHLHLPPSFGDPEISGFGSSLLDDLAPDMSKILYAVKVVLTKGREDGSENVIASASKKIRVKPSFEEQPPIDIDGKTQEYCHRQEKTIRKGVFKGKLGRLVVEASQPKSFRHPATASNELPPVSTMAKVSLRFDPCSENSPPPRLGSLSSRLKAMTYFATTPRQKFPDRASSLMDMSQGYLSDMLSMSSMCVASVEWRKHEAWESPVSRRDSALSTATAESSLSTITMGSNTVSATAIPDPSTSYRGKSFYTATILVPMSLPTNKNLVPTFHNCLISRLYAVHLTISTHGQPLGPSLSLKLPVQISSDGSLGAMEKRRESEQIEQAVRDADAAFEPRNVAPPSSDLAGRSEIGGASEPPSYNSYQTGEMTRMNWQRGGVRIPVAV